MATKIIPIKCPACGANISYEEGRKALNYGKDGRLACIYYNEKGEKTEEHTLNTVSQPIPDNLQKLGFFDEYPTPSSLDK